MWVPVYSSSGRRVSAVVFLTAVADGDWSTLHDSREGIDLVWQDD